MFRTHIYALRVYVVVVRYLAPTYSLNQTSHVFQKTKHGAHALKSKCFISFVRGIMLGPVVGDTACMHIPKREIDARSVNVQPGFLPPIPQDNEVLEDPLECLLPGHDRTSPSEPAGSLCLWKRNTGSTWLVFSVLSSKQHMLFVVTLTAS